MIPIFARHATNGLRRLARILIVFFVTIDLRNLRNSMEWISVKDRPPPLGMVVECIGPKNWFYSKLGRDYFALVKVNNKLIWITPSLTDFEGENELDIKYWRYILPDPSGKIPYVKIIKYNSNKSYTCEPKVIFKKYDLIHK